MDTSLSPADSLGGDDSEPGELALSINIGIARMRLQSLSPYL